MPHYIHLALAGLLLNIIMQNQTSKKKEAKFSNKQFKHENDNDKNNKNGSVKDMDYWHKCYHNSQI